MSQICKKLPTAAQHVAAKVLGRIALGLTVLLMIVLKIGAFKADADCQSGKDYPGDLRCYFAQLPTGDCYDSYFGFTTPPSYSTALKCFEREKSWPFLVTMYLNGQGTPRDLRKAEQWFSAGETMPRTDLPGAWDDREVSSLKEAMDEIQSGDSDKVDLCENIFTRTTYKIDFCKSIDELVEERKLTELVARTRASLGPAHTRLFDKLVATFRAFQEAESNRTYNEAGGGTIRNASSMAQAALVRSDFITLLEKTVRKRDLATLDGADPVAFAAADDVLNRVYRNDVCGARARCTKAQRTAEVAWIRYRDTWVDLVVALYPKGADNFDPELGMKTALTKMRVQELMKSEEP